MTEADDIEAMARAIFEHWHFRAPVPWVNGGNSDKQTEARSYAHFALAALKSRNWQRMPEGSVVVGEADLTSSRLRR